MSIREVLVVDDDSLSREFLVEAMTSLGFRALQAKNGDEGCSLACSASPDLVITDLRMPGTDGMGLIRKLSEQVPGLPVVMITAHGTVETAVQAMNLGAHDFLMKPVTAEALKLVIERVDRTLRLERENRYLRAEVVGAANEIVAESPAMQETLKAAKRVARSKGTVLVTGESGTGKERIAHYIHRESPRQNGPFIRVNCAALTETLLESELFGHERGAFTGAHKTREGRFELADKGTLLLDEIGELSPTLQSKLLRVLEEEEFERVGGSSTLRVDVRVIATTNRDLAAEVARGAFREDLYYRLHVLPIHMKPLRERPQDVLALARHFVKSYAAQNGLEAPKLARESEDRLRAWSWPGNVRELENVIQRAIVLMSGDTIQVDDLSFGPSGQNAMGPTSTVGGQSAASGHAPGGLNMSLANRSLADIEREAILATLYSTGGNKTEAARRMGVSARTLSNKMKLWRRLGLVA